MANALKGWDAPVARKGEKGGTPVPEQGDSRPQRAPGAMGGAAKRQRAGKGAVKAT